MRHHHIRHFALEDFLLPDADTINAFLLSEEDEWPEDHHSGEEDGDTPEDLARRMERASEKFIRA